MRGATAPRLLLELICARVLLPGADHSTEGVQARLDRLERRMTDHRWRPVPPAPTAPARRARRSACRRAPPRRRPTRRARRRADRPPARRAPTAPGSWPSRPPSRRARARGRPRAPAAGPRPPTEPAAGSTLTLVDVRRLWPDIVEATKQRRRVTWIHLTQQAQVVAVDATSLTLGFGNAGARDSFDNGGSAEIVRQAAIDVVGHDWQVETIVDPGAQPGPPAAPRPRRHRRPSAAPAEASARRGGRATSEATAPDGARPSERRARRPRPPRRPRRATARQAIAPDPHGRSGRGRGARARPTPTAAPAATTPSRVRQGLDGAELLQRALGRPGHRRDPPPVRDDR